MHVENYQSSMPMQLRVEHNIYLHLPRLVLGSIVGIQVVILPIRIVCIIIPVILGKGNRRHSGKDDNDRPSHDDIYDAVADLDFVIL